MKELIYLSLSFASAFIFIPIIAYISSLAYILTDTNDSCIIQIFMGIVSILIFSIVLSLYVRYILFELMAKIFYD